MANTAVFLFGIRVYGETRFVCFQKLVEISAFGCSRLAIRSDQSFDPIRSAKETYETPQQMSLKARPKSQGVQLVLCSEGMCPFVEHG